VIAPRPDADVPTNVAHTDSHVASPAASRIAAPFERSVLDSKIVWTVPEVAFMCRVGVRTVWRLMADPNSRFPSPRRIRGRTLLARDEVLAFLAKEGRR
jgi:predicted DNA-binding transcriptional regulator AlpA